MGKNIEINVFKRTHCGKTTFVIEKDGALIYDCEGILDIAGAIKMSSSLNRKGKELKIDCSPDCEITRMYRKNPSHNEALSPEDEKLLFDELNR